MNKISPRQLERFPIYLKYLFDLKDSGVNNVSASSIARSLGYSVEKVRKDLQIVSSSEGIPNQGRNIGELIKDIQKYLGYNHLDNAIVIGVGHLGKAFMNYSGFEEFGLNIVAGFDVNPDLIGTEINGKKIMSLYSLSGAIANLDTKIAILSTPNKAAQEVVNRLVNAGIKAIWNFVPTHIDVPEDVVVENVNLASSLAILSHKLKNIK